MLGHGRSRFLAHAPIGQHRRPPAGPTNSARAESDRVACLCPSATVQICNPRMSRAARPDVASAWRQSTLEPANAQRPVGSRVGLTRCYPTIESDRCPAVLARRCSHRPAPRGAARHEFGGVGNEALKPGQLVIEFRSRLRIPVGEVDGSDQDSLNRRFNVASLMIFRVSRQACAGQHGNVVSRENGHAVPGALPLPDCFVPESPKGIHGKGFLFCLELLETHHVRFSFR
jgi:hypothetical protein